LFVLEAARRGAFDDIEIVVCTSDTEHIYSGMLPGWIRGEYGREQVSLPVRAIVERSGARLVAQHVEGLTADGRAVRLSDDSVLAADAISIAVGSIPTGLELPGVRAHAVGIKPFAGLADIVARIAAGAITRLVVVGGGVAGAELALAFQAARAPQPVAVTLVSRDQRIALERGLDVSARVHTALTRAGVNVLAPATALGAEPGALLLRQVERPARLDTDLIVWATGPAASPWLATTPLTTDDAGFIVVDDHLRSVSHAWVHAAGDCATLQSAPERARAGVYAVRMGPALTRSLRAALGLATLTAPYRPQRRWLSLLDTSDGGAIAQWGPLVAQGRWAMRLKRAIDTRFVKRFRPRTR
jgi:selenide,water dikinase/sulfide:quinone oxidoreductase